MKKRNMILFLFIVIAAIIWGGVYWYFIAPFAGPNK
ncbi:YdgA family protein [Sporosarcina luteola]|nr:YdgA family protein [Sporosarcina luteola]MCM3709817.1 YdgA family protein [Sporosarcina luteola]